MTDPYIQLNGSNIQVTAPALEVDHIAEKTAAHGVALDAGGILAKDTTISTDHIAEITGAHGVALDDGGILAKDVTVSVDHLAEITASHGIALDNKLTVKSTVQTVTGYTPAGAATATLDLTTGNIHSITMPAGNITIAISNEVAGQCFLIEITQDGGGSRTVTWFTTIKWAGGSAPTLTTTASKRDVFGFRVTGADTYDGYVVGQNI